MVYFMNKDYLKRMPGSTISNYHRYLFTKIIKMLDQTKQELVIVNIGAGAGIPLKYFLQYLKEQGHGIVSAYAFDALYSNAYLEDGIHFYPLDINKEELPLKEASVDILITTEVIEHLLIPENLLSEANRVLKDGSFLLLSTPNLCW